MADNPIGWLLTALADDYQDRKPYIGSNSRKSSDKFINYEQREWDYEKIERLAMEIQEVFFAKGDGSCVSTPQNRPLMP